MPLWLNRRVAFRKTSDLGLKACSDMIFTLQSQRLALCRRTLSTFFHLERSKWGEDPQGPARWDPLPEVEGGGES